MANVIDPEPRRWSWKLGRIQGVAIHVHATFVLLLALIAVSHLAARQGVAMAVQGVVLVVAMFAIVVIHELAHALVAKRFGIPTRDITLYPIGGVARLERMPERPVQELLVAIAGPFTNGVLALAIYGGLVLSGAGAGGDPLTLGASFAVQLMWINVSLGAFNLLPAFPMDGGRILRAALALRMERSRATQLAARIGRAIAVVMGVAGLVYSPMLALIAVFVWIAGGQEAAMERLKTSLRGLAVRDAMIAEFQTLAPDTPLEIAAARLAGSFQHDFPIVEGGRAIGMLTGDDVVRGLATRTGDTPVAELMHRRFPVAGALEGLDSLLARLPKDSTSVVVVRDDRPVGIVDLAHVGPLIASRRIAEHPR